MFNGKQIRPVVLEDILMSFLGGNTFSSYSFSGEVPKTTYQRYEKLVCEAVEFLAIQEFESACKRIKDADLDIYVASNGAWSHRCWKARSSSYVIRIEKATKLGVIYDIPQVFLLLNMKKDFCYTRADGKSVKITGNYSGTSRSMENEALRRAMDVLRKADILSHIKTWAMDEDSSSQAIIESDEDCKHIQIASDPGHKRSNFLRSMTAILTGKRYATIAKRIATWYLTLLKRVEREVPGLLASDQKERKRRFSEYWMFTKSHYTTTKCGQLCPCLYPEAYQDRVTDIELNLLMELMAKLEHEVDSSSTSSSTSSTSSSSSSSSSSSTSSTSSSSSSSSSSSFPLNPLKTDRKFYFDLKIRKTSPNGKNWSLFSPRVVTVKSTFSP